MLSAREATVYFLQHYWYHRVRHWIQGKGPALIQTHVFQVSCTISQQNLTSRAGCWATLKLTCISWHPVNNTYVHNNCRKGWERIRLEIRSGHDLPIFRLVRASRSLWRHRATPWLRTWISVTLHHSATVSHMHHDTTWSGSHRYSCRAFAPL